MKHNPLRPQVAIQRRGPWAPSEPTAAKIGGVMIAAGGVGLVVAGGAAAAGLFVVLGFVLMIGGVVLADHAARRK